MVVFDTNVLVYAADEAAAEHESCKSLLETCRTGRLPWFTTWGIIYEFLRVVTHARVFRKPMKPAQAWSFVEALLSAPSLQILVETPRHREIMEQSVREIPTLRGNLWHDLHTAVLMREHGIRRVYTRDADFNRFPFVEPADPLREPSSV